ncbi:hypothetical protein C1646_751489 [Rhizophagus diaphanus]|nr:hypothetical protein C1646_751489 [Rhizophagus diaphanus] [Rhizophagus sp. MUCL 43196]
MIRSTHTNSRYQGNRTQQQRRVQHQNTSIQTGTSSNSQQQQNQQEQQQNNTETIRRGGVHWNEFWRKRHLINHNCTEECQIKSFPTVSETQSLQLKQSYPTIFFLKAESVHIFATICIFLDNFYMLFKDNVIEISEFITAELTVEKMKKLWDELGFVEVYDTYAISVYDSLGDDMLINIVKPFVIHVLEDISYLGIGGKVVIEDYKLVYKKYS